MFAIIAMAIATTTTAIIMWTSDSSLAWGFRFRGSGRFVGMWCGPHVGVKRRFQCGRLMARRRD
jgi:hypothetical protein